MLLGSSFDLFPIDRRFSSTGKCANLSEETLSDMRLKYTAPEGDCIVGGIESLQRRRCSLVPVMRIG